MFPDSFQFVEFTGMSIITAVWFMFATIGSGLFGRWVWLELTRINTRLDHHSETIDETRDRLSEMRTDIALTRSAVEDLKADMKPIAELNQKVLRSFLDK